MRLAAETGAAEVVQGRYDAELSEQVWGDDADNDGFTAYLIRHGMPEEMARRSTEDESRLAVSPAPTTRLVDEGDTVDLGGEQFTVHVLPGHADGHIVLAGQRSGRVFGGDVLLAEITPNVGRWPDTAADPLGSYLHSLERLAGFDPVLVLPGHGPVIEDARARCAEIAEHHAERLDTHLAVLEAGARRPTMSPRRSGRASSASTSSASPWSRRSRTWSGSSARAAQSSWPTRGGRRCGEAAATSARDPPGHPDHGVRGAGMADLALGGCVAAARVCGPRPPGGDQGRPLRDREPVACAPGRGRGRDRSRAGGRQARLPLPPSPWSSSCWPASRWEW